MGHCTRSRSRGAKQKKKRRGLSGSRVYVAPSLDVLHTLKLFSTHERRRSSR
jgi:hypothetical protein